MTAPTDGHGIYESIASSLGQGVWGPRLDQIAAGGFSLVLNYGLLFGSVANVQAYINYAASKGMKVIVAIHNAVIWDTVGHSSYTDLAAEYVTMYAAAGSPTTNWTQTFSQYVVNQVKGLSGTWGYYIADEPTNGQHTQLSAYYGYVTAADNTKPILIIAQGEGGTSFSDSSANFWDCCTVGGDDYYPVGDTYPLTTAQMAAGIQSYCTTKGIQSAMTLQAFSWQQFPGVSSVSSQPFPTHTQMRTARDTAIANMSPRLILWFSYYNAIDGSTVAFSSGDQQWANVEWAVNGVGPRAVTSFGLVNV